MGTPLIGLWSFHRTVQMLSWEPLACLLLGGLFCMLSTVPLALLSERAPLSKPWLFLCFTILGSQQKAADKQDTYDINYIGVQTLQVLLKSSGPTMPLELGLKSSSMHHTVSVKVPGHATHATLGIHGTGGCNLPPSQVGVRGRTRYWFE